MAKDRDDGVPADGAARCQRHDVEIQAGRRRRLPPGTVVAQSRLLRDVALSQRA